MAHYDIFRHHLAMKFPAYGHALWEPDPGNLYPPVEVGDVGYIREGKFRRLFNVLYPAEHPSHSNFGVPEYHEQLTPSVEHHIETSTLSPHNFYSSAVTELDPDRWPGGDGPKKEGEFTFSCPKEQGAVLCLPIPATRNDTVAREAFGKWMIKHIDGWFAWARKLELGIVWIKDIVLVTGTHRTRSCINVAFPARREDKEDAQASFRAKVDHRGAINWQVSHNRGAVLNRGPDGEDLPEDQCIFIRGFRVTRKLKLLPLKLKGAAGPNPDPEGYNEEPDAEDMPIEGSDAEDKPMEESDAEVMPMEEPDSDDEPDSEIMPIPDVPEYRDPLHTLLEYIAEETPNCDMVLVHDDDLTRLDGIDDGTPLDGLQSDVVLSHIRSLEPTIYKTRIDTSSTRNNTSVDTESVLVATFSNILDKRSPSSTPSAPQSLHGEMPLPREERPRGHPPFAFPEPNVPGGYGYPQGYLTDDSTYTPSQQPVGGYGYPRPPRPYQLPKPKTRYHTRPSLTTFPHTFPDARIPDRFPPPSYPFGAPGVPEPPYPPAQSYGASPPYETVSSHASGSHSQVRQPHHNLSPNNHASLNPPTWPALPQPLYGVGREYQPHRPYPHVVQPFYPRVGLKKALLVGINYSQHPDRGFRLKWGVFDACEMARFLHESFGFEWSNMQILTDDQPGNLPTKANIQAAMHWLVKGAQPGDTLFYYFSGHATRVKDTNGDEPDGYDECICAMDYMGNGQLIMNPTTPGIIVDDDMHDIMVRPLPRGCRLTVVLDCYHSGTLFNLPFIYDSRGLLKLTDPIVVQQRSSEADVIYLSACKDSESAIEARDGGALRKAFIEYMTSSGNHRTYLDILRSLLAYMVANGFRQRPQLSSSNPIDVNQPFLI